jgi:hypothetical protein
MGGEARKPQGDDYFFVWLDLKCHFGALGIAAKNIILPVPL